MSNCFILKGNDHIKASNTKSLPFLISDGNTFAIDNNEKGDKIRQIISINGKTDLSDVIKFGNTGCVHSITVKETASNLLARKYKYEIEVDAEGPREIYKWGILKFTDETNDTYILNVFGHNRQTYVLNYNSINPEIIKVEWIDSGMLIGNLSKIDSMFYTMKDHMIGYYKVSSIKNKDYETWKDIASEYYYPHIFLILDSDGNGYFYFRMDKLYFHGKITWEENMIIGPTGENIDINYDKSYDTLTLEINGTTMTYLKTNDRNEIAFMMHERYSEDV